MSGIHHDLTEALYERISALPRGARLASESDIMAEFGVSRGTVRQALGNLERSHTVVRRQGMGTFVARPYDCHITRETTSLHAQVSLAGGECRTVSLGSETVPVPDHAAAWLGVPRQTPVARLQRLGFVDGEVAVHLRELFAPEVVAEVGVAVQVIESVGEIHRSARIDPYPAPCRATLSVPSVEVRRHLELSPGEPVWRVDSLLRDRRTDRALIVSRNHSRPDLVRMVVDLEADEVNGGQTRPPSALAAHEVFTALPPRGVVAATSHA